MSKLWVFILGVLAALAAVFIPASRKPTAKEENDKMDAKLKEIKEKVDETSLDDLVSESNKRYGPGSKPSDS